MIKGNAKRKNTIWEMAERPKERRWQAEDPDKEMDVGEEKERFPVDSSGFPMVEGKDNELMCPICLLRT